MTASESDSLNETENTLSAMVHAEQVRLLYKPFTLSAIATVLAAAMFVAVQWPVINHTVLLAWLGLLYLITLSRIILAAAFKRTNPDTASVGKWGNWFLVGVGAAGLTWGMGSVLLFPESNVEHQLIVVLVMLAMASGAVTSLSVYRKAVLLFVTPVMLPVLPLFLKTDDHVAILVVPMMMLSYYFFIKSANNINQTARDNIRLRINALHREKLLETEKIRADQANRAKSEFLARMSHELRTPLNAVLGFSQLIELDAKEDLVRENAAEITHAGTHLLQLINEILDLAKIESGKLDISLRKTPLNDIVDDCLKLSKSTAEQFSIELLNQIPENPEIRILCDPVRMKEVLLNLLSNAIKYNRENGSVHISCEPVAGERVRISVTDTGAGLNENQQKHLFQAFERMGAENTAIEGTGIGLVISKKLTEIMNGNIGYRSQVGKGTTFWVEIPVAQN